MIASVLVIILHSVFQERLHKCLAGNMEQRQSVKLYTVTINIILRLSDKQLQSDIKLGILYPN